MGIPDAVMQRSNLAEKVANKVGVHPIRVFVNEGRLNPARYLRARVFVKPDTPLVRFVPLTLKESKNYPVEYEKLPKFCYFCGLIGHEVTECGDGIHSPDKCEWGDWLLVQFDNSAGHGTSGAPRGGGSMGRGGGFGRGRGNPGDPNLQESEDMELENAVIPLAHKRLISQDGMVVINTSTMPPGGFVNDKVNLFENVNREPVDKSLLSMPQKVHDNKRQKLGFGTDNDAAKRSSATSFEEDRRTQ